MTPLARVLAPGGCTAPARDHEPHHVVLSAHPSQHHDHSTIVPIQRDEPTSVEGGRVLSADQARVGYQVLDRQTSADDGHPPDPRPGPVGGGTACTWAGNRKVGQGRIENTGVDPDGTTVFRVRPDREAGSTPEP